MCGFANMQMCEFYKATHLTKFAHLHIRKSAHHLILLLQKITPHNNAIPKQIRIVPDTLLTMERLCKVSRLRSFPAIITLPESAAIFTSRHTEKIITRCFRVCVNDSTVAFPSQKIKT